MKKLMVVGAAGVLSLAIGTSVFAADFSGRNTGRMACHHIMMPAGMAGSYVKPALGVTAVRYSAGGCSSICAGYTDADNDGVCDNWQGGGYGYDSGYGNGGGGWCGGGGHHSGGHRGGCQGF